MPNTVLTYLLLVLLLDSYIYLAILVEFTCCVNAVMLLVVVVNKAILQFIHWSTK